MKGKNKSELFLSRHICECHNCFPEWDNAKMLEKQKNANKNPVPEIFRIIFVGNFIIITSFSFNRGPESFSAHLAHSFPCLEY